MFASCGGEEITDCAALNMSPFYDQKRLTGERVYKGMKSMELPVGWIQVKTIIDSKFKEIGLRN